MEFVGNNKHIDQQLITNITDTEMKLIQAHLAAKTENKLFKSSWQYDRLHSEVKLSVLVCLKKEMFF